MNKQFYHWQNNKKKNRKKTHNQTNNPIASNIDNPHHTVNAFI